MDWTPPSLYLFETGKEFWAEISSPAPNVAEYQAIQLDLPHAARRWGRRILYNSYEQIPASGFGRSSWPFRLAGSNERIEAAARHWSVTAKDRLVSSPADRVYNAPVPLLRIEQLACSQHSH